MPSRFYRVDVGALVELVALDSEFFDVCGVPSLCVFDFLRAALRTFPAPRWTRVMAHRPLASASATSYDERRLLEQREGAALFRRDPALGHVLRDGFVSDR